MTGEIIQKPQLTDEERAKLEAELKQINEQMSNYQTRAFSMLLELLPIIGIPAIIVIFLRNYVFSQMSGGVTALLIIIALTTSWYFIFKKSANLSSATGKLSRRRKEIRQRLGLAAPEPKIYPDELEAEADRDWGVSAKKSEKL